MVVGAWCLDFGTRNRNSLAKWKKAFETNSKDVETNMVANGQVTNNSNGYVLFR